MNRTPIAVLLALVLACGCSPQTDSQVAKAVGELSEQQTVLEARLAKLEAAPVIGDAWVLWEAESYLSLPGGKFPTAEGAYPTKEACLAAASVWTIPGGQRMSVDPYVAQNKTTRMTLRCLPKGVDPLPKR